MRTSFVKNGLVLVVILLFVGVAVQPSIAVNPITSDNEEDCNLCAKNVSKPYLVLLKSLLNRVEILNNKLSMLSKLNPEFEEKYQELSDRITTLADMNRIYLSYRIWPFPIICLILGDFFLVPAASLIEGFAKIARTFPVDSIFCWIFSLLSDIIYYTILPIIKIGLVLGCWEIVDEKAELRDSVELEYA